MSRHKIGIVGAGNISGIYLEAPRKFSNLEVVALADLDLDKARAQAAKYGVPKACTVDELLALPEVEGVVNLTVPSAHAEVSRAALQAGKHVYTEKPLATVLEEGQELLRLARSEGLELGSAPDTFLGGGLQHARQLLDEGVIGEPVAFQAAMLSHGPEAWHPSPEFFYQPGAGPLFDMGPYYLTALVALLGPVAAVSGFSRASFPTRTVGSGPKKGEAIAVNTPTHVTASLELASGVIGTLTTSFDTYWEKYDTLVIYGSKGTMVLPDPNSFGGNVRIWKDKAWHESAPAHPFTENSRGMGLSEMLHAHARGREPRASGSLALHVLETMHAILRSSRERQAVAVHSQPAQPAPLPLGSDEEILR
ncbi:MAG: Gfo/Idh/MocA family oxidoreductase [Thermaceae bacterium]|nr:Gfo/Idh/MocA family oxidoreductase [Thermaceae bacterium]